MSLDSTSKVIVGQFGSAAALKVVDPVPEASIGIQTLDERRKNSIMLGYTGNVCGECQNFTMAGTAPVRNA
jgi:hypothetical protein